MCVLPSHAAKKKSKKGKTLTLTDFLAEDSGGSGAPPSYPTKTTSWADETDDLDGDGERELEDAPLFFPSASQLNYFIPPLIFPASSVMQRFEMLAKRNSICRFLVLQLTCSLSLSLTHSVDLLAHRGGQLPSSPHRPLHPAHSSPVGS